MSARFRPMFAATTHLSCLGCRQAFSRWAFNRHLVPMPDATHLECPTTYRDQLLTIDEAIG